MKAVYETNHTAVCDIIEVPATFADNFDAIVKHNYNMLTASQLTTLVAEYKEFQQNFAGNSMYDYFEAIVANALLDEPISQ
jgi:hypothetical protein